MKAKKSYGQHFLRHKNLAQRIARQLEWTGPTLEVGPGKGILTECLLEQGLPLKVVEADHDMVAYLQEHYPQLDGRIIAADFLRLRLEDTFDRQNFALVGNFPYNISSQIVFKMLQYRDLVPEMVGMFQKEMAERIIAGPGGKDYGIIGVLTQAFYDAQYLFTVDRSNFNPPPKVQSGVIRLLRRPGPLRPIADEGLFKQMVKAAFGQRRKMLRNTLKPFFPADILENSRFQERPEQISVDGFIELANEALGYAQQPEA